MAGRARRYDWDEARRLYVEEGLSVRDVAKRLGAAPRTVQDRSQEGGWESARKKYRAESTDRAWRKAARKNGDTLGDFIAGVRGVREAITEKLLDRLQEDSYKPTPTDLAQVARIEIGLYEARDQLGRMSDAVRRALAAHDIPEAEIEDTLADLLTEAGEEA